MKYLISAFLVFSLIIPAYCALKVGDTAPDFELKDIRTGDKVKLSSFKGQVVVLHMWKNNWRECRAEIPHLIKMEKELLNELFPGNVEGVKAKFGSLLRILSINAINPAPALMSEIKKYGMNFQVLEGRGSGVTKDYAVSNLPMLIIIDKTGKIRTYTQYLKYDDLKNAVIPWIKDITGQ